MSETDSTSQLEDDPESDHVPTEAMRRNRLAELIGRLLARVMLRQQTGCSETPIGDEEQFSDL
ncbi:MAG: hypothetical protein CMJ62_10835 [Planctomycetaceae bacterium]|nr:hypothetical protein [Planctomycetaceae bacterium]